jgi:ribosome-associated heat shock protein Hsp15
MEVRADTWLWAIRMYKSRTLASDAIKGGKVKRNGQNFKASHVVKVGETFTLTVGDTKKIVEVTDLLDKRGSYEVAKKHYKDLSPIPEKSENLPSAFFKMNVKRDKGTGRPTKKDRRDLDSLEF